MMPRFTTVTSLPTVERRASNEMERISREGHLTVATS